MHWPFTCSLIEGISNHLQVIETRRGVLLIRATIRYVFPICAVGHQCIIDL